MSKTYTFLCLFSVALFGACEKGDIEYESSFEHSYQTWLKFKAANGNTYRYEVSGATWAGSSWLTTLTVKEGRVVQRDFRYEVFNDVRMPDDGWASIPIAELLHGLGFNAEDFLEQEGKPFHEALQWTETEAELGLHEKTPASRLQTLDEVYETARSVWLKKRGDAETYFEAKNDGMISSAGFVPNGCMDDCFSGIHIRSIATID
ncbi:hypothetical protein ACFOET_00285 [Parapedobacter deserti]|uniref:Uncharacterized protein n=1 Tax=Parapedobacter deserti TaxID=1912957 RepID=A0ABV7JD82_9SPHI